MVRVSRPRERWRGPSCGGEDRGERDPVLEALTIVTFARDPCVGRGPSIARVGVTAHTDPGAPRMGLSHKTCPKAKGMH